MEQLNVDEIMALQAFGMRDAEIRKLRLDDFDRKLEENPDLEDMLDKVNALLDRQEEQGVVSIPWHAEAFPERLNLCRRMMSWKCSYVYVAAALRLMI